MNTILLLYDRLITALALAAAAILGALALWITYEVGMRYFIRSPTSWAVDLSEYALLWAVFLAAPWVLRQDEHIKLDLVVDRLPPRLRRWLGIATSLAGAAICAVMTWHGIIAEWDLYVRNVDFAHEWQVRQYAVYPIIPIGFLLLTIEFLRQAGRFCLGARDPTVGAGQTGEKPAVS